VRTIAARLVADPNTVRNVSEGTWTDLVWIASGRGSPNEDDWPSKRLARLNEES
jgi:hypothetical protein